MTPSGAGASGSPGARSPLRALLLALAACRASRAAIDRAAVVARHNPRAGLPLDPSLVTSLGNGAFAFSVDPTGLQSLNATFAAPFDLNTLADWAWHTQPGTRALLQAYNYSTYHTADGRGGAREVRYPTGSNSSSVSGQSLHGNPQRMPLAQVALAWQAPGGGELLAPADVRAAAQTLDAWAGAALSNTTLNGGRPDRDWVQALVRTTVHPDVDALAVRVELASRAVSVRPPPLVLRLAFAYVTQGGASDWRSESLHETRVAAAGPGFLSLERTLDGAGYTVDCAFNATWGSPQPGASPHVFTLAPPAGDSSAASDLVCLFAPRDVRFPVGADAPWLAAKRDATLALRAAGAARLPGFGEVAAAAAAAWEAFWLAGAFVDLASGTDDPAAFELERRVVRSLALLRALEAGAEPPPETGLLLAGGWSGKHHGEMRFWHQAWAPFWGRSEVLSRSDAWYSDYLPNATSVAASQGFRGARWPKMIAAAENRSAADVPWVGLDFAPLPPAVNGGVLDGLAPLLAWESSSGVGPLLVWQQSHSILLAEAQRRAAAAAGGAPAALAVMQRLAPVVFATAEFLASFPVRDAASGVYHLEPPLYGGEEQGDPLDVRDPAFELVQIGEALDTAAAWRAAMALPPVPEWAAVAGGLAQPPFDPATVGGGAVPLYANNAACACMYTRGACAFNRTGCPAPLTSHPMTSGLSGMLNGLGGDGGARRGLVPASVNATIAAVLANWSWGDLSASPDVWGWDAPLVALGLTRTGWSPESCVGALLLASNKNLYSRAGINQGMGTDTAYFPGNGGTLLAVAGMAAGFDGGAPGAQLVEGGPGAVASSPTTPVGFPSAWGAVIEGFDVPLP